MYRIVKLLANIAYFTGYPIKFFYSIIFKKEEKRKVKEKYSDNNFLYLPNMKRKRGKLNKKYVQEVQEIQLKRIEFYINDELVI